MKRIALVFIVAAILASIAGFISAAYAAQGGGQTLNTLAGVFVHKVGDTMTGALNLPTLNCSGRITGESLTITNVATSGAVSTTSIQLGTAAADAGTLKFIMGAQAGDPSVSAAMDTSGGITFTMDTAAQPFTIDNVGSGSSGLLVLKGGGGSAGTGILRCNDEDDAEYATIYASGGQGYIKTDGSGPGQLNLQADIKGDVACFGLTNTGDTNDGKKLTVHRKAAEGNNQVDIYIDNARQPTITADAGSIATVTLKPLANDLYALGAAANSFSDLFLASGGVVNWNNGDTTLTHSTGVLTLNNKLAAANVQLTDTATANAYSGVQNSALGIYVPNQPVGGNAAGVGLTIKADDGGALTGATGAGGSITLRAGDAKGDTTNGNAGHIYLTTGAAVLSGDPGAIIVNSSQGIYGVATKDFYIGTRTQGTSNADGKDCQLYAGSGGSGGTGNHNGGSVWLIPGYKAGSGTDGAVLPGSNNYFNLGASGTVWKNVYATAFTGSGTSLTGIGLLGGDNTWTGMNTFEAIDADQITVTGTVAAMAFAGDGSHLTGLAQGTILYYLRSYPSDVSTYNAMSTNYDTASAEAPIAKTSIAAGDLVKTFATPAGFPGLNILPDEPWSVHFHAQRTGGNKSVTLKAELYKRSGTANIIIDTSEATVPITDTKAPFDIHGLIPEGTTIEATDRLVVNLFAATVGSGSATDITIYVEGADISHLEIPGPTVSIANFVPYAGATSATNLGVHNLTTTGTLQGTSLKASDLTATRVTYAGASGLLSDSSNMTFAGNTLTVTGTVSATQYLGNGALLSGIGITTGVNNVWTGTNRFTNISSFEGANYVSIEVKTPSAAQSITAAGGIVASYSYMRVQGNAGPIDITANPQIAAGIDGQVLLVEGRNDTNTVQLDNGTGLVLAGAQSFTLGKNDMIRLVYNSTDGAWVENCRSSN